MKKVFVVHGGLPEDINVTLEKLESLDRTSSSKKKDKSSGRNENQIIRDSLLFGDVDITGKITKTAPIPLAFKFGHEHAASFFGQK